MPYFNRYSGSPCVAFCNEEGKLHGLPINPVAHALWEKATGRLIRDDYLVGSIAVVAGPHSFLRDM